MKRTLLSAAVIAASFMASTWTAQAQMSTLRANIPFAFEAGGKMHSPGEYRMDVNLGANQILLWREDVRGNGVFLPPAESITSLTNFDKPYLKFRRHGDQYFLREASTGYTKKLAWGASKAEKKLTSPFEVALVYAK